MNKEQVLGRVRHNGTEYAPPHCLVQLSCISRNQDYVSKNFERWKELAALTSKEQDSAKLTELAKEMHLVLTQKNTVPRCTTARASGGVERREPTRRRSGGNCWR